MSTTPSSRPTPPEAILCPFCGMAQFTQGQCSACHRPLSDRGRKIAQIEMGPWYVRNKANPFGPGYSYEMMKRLADDGVLTAKSIVRGPSTQQFWLMAKFTPGISHLVGHCFACPSPAKAAEACCGVCKVPFKEYPDRNALGLRYKTEEEAQTARKELSGGSSMMMPALKAGPKKKTDPEFPEFKPKEAPANLIAPQQAVMEGDKPGAAFTPGADLLDQIFGKQ